MLIHKLCSVSTLTTSDLAKGGLSKGPDPPLPYIQMKSKSTLIEQSNILLKQSAIQAVPLVSLAMPLVTLVALAQRHHLSNG